jgi:hypothetical protein
MSVTENAAGIKFSELERTIFNFAHELARNLLTDTLEALSQKLHMELDSTRYENKGTRETSIHTLFGTVSYKRHVYYDHGTQSEDGRSKCVYPLDEKLGMTVFQTYTEAVVETVLKRCTETSFRKAAASVSEMTGLSVSHATAWSMFQEFGRSLTLRDQALVDQDQKNELDGPKVVPVLFEETDGVYVPIQRKGRKKPAKERKEIRLAVTYEGWKKPKECDRHLLVNKHFVSGLADVSDFNKLRSASIAQRYDMANVKLHALNGDGAAWIRQGHEGRKSIYQMDPFHWQREVLRATASKKESRILSGLLNAGKFEQAMDRIQELKYECGGEAKRVKALEELQVYLSTLRGGLQPWKQRDGQVIPEPPDGLTYRNMGTMEHHICDVLGLRMKGRKMSWSPNGASHMAKALACSMNGELSSLVDCMMAGKVPQEMETVVTRTVDEARNRVVKRVRRVFETHPGGWPFENSAMTLSRKAIRGIFHMKNFTELAYH